MIDRIWSWLLWLPVTLGQIANSYSRLPGTIANHRVPVVRRYYVWELPSDSQCDDLPNKRKWLHRYARTKREALAPIIELKREKVEEIK